MHRFKGFEENQKTTDTPSRGTSDRTGDWVAACGHGFRQWHTSGIFNLIDLAGNVFSPWHYDCGEAGAME
jgi:hypothetical protein